MTQHGHRPRLAVLALAASLAAIRPVRAEPPTERRLRPPEETVGQPQQEVESAKRWFNLPDWLGRVSLFGDFRFRHEGFYDQPHAEGKGPDKTLILPISRTVTARSRERIRARLGLKFTYSDELSATFRAASGNPDDPISTNETVTGNWSRKHVNLDWAFLTFAPGRSAGIRPGAVSISAGKLPNPIFRTDEMVFDEDLAPEGLSETFELLASPWGNLDQLKLHGLQWTFNEVTNARDGWMFGGQLNPQWHAGPVQLEGGLGQYWWLDPGRIAQALRTNKALINTNLLATKRGKITGYRSGFEQTNLTLAATVPDVVLAQPLRAFLDYVYNWEAATSDAHGVTVGFRLGQANARGDWAVTAFYERLAQEAAISSLTFSELGLGGTNQEGPGIKLQYQLLNPLTVSATGYFTRFINQPNGVTNPMLKRVQLDAGVRW